MAQSVQAKPQGDLGTRDYREIDLKLLIESRHNPRKTFDGKTIEDLASSIKEHGVINPLIVRRVGNDGKFEVLAGARRLKASLAAGLVTVPCLVIEAENDKAVELIVIDNLQRENVHPLEEAEGFREILDLSNGDMAGLCAKIGKPASFVSKRLSLLLLIDKAQKVYLKGGMTEHHAIILSRLQKNDQKETLEYIEEQNPSLSDLRSFVESELMLEMTKAPWDKSDGTLLPKAGSCIVCPKRTGQAKDLFDDIKGGDRCTDGACWKLKMAAHIDRIHKAFEEKGGKVYGIWSGYKHDPPKGTLPDSRWLKIGDKKHPLCERKAVGIFLDGSTPGVPIDICPDPRDCKIHGSIGLHGKTPVEREKTRKEVLKQRIEKETRARILRKILDSDKPLNLADQKRVCIHAFDRLWHQVKGPIVKMMGWEPKKGKYGNHDFSFVAKKVDGFLTQFEVARFLVAISCAGDLDPRTSFGHDLEYFAKGRKVDVKKVRQEVASEFEKKSKRLPSTGKKRTSKKTSPAKPLPASSTVSEPESSNEDYAQE